MKFNIWMSYVAAPLWFHLECPLKISEQKLPRNYFKWDKYPDMLNTSPQDVAMKNIVRNIRRGMPVCYGSNII